MKSLTKEWVKDIDFKDLIEILKPVSSNKIPFILLNGEKELVAKEDLYTIKSNLNVKEEENRIDFVLIPNRFNSNIEYIARNKSFIEKTYLTSFVYCYLSRLRAISYLPEDILKSVKDKRLLALGYAEKNAKKEILCYIESKYKQAYDLLQKINKDNIKAGKELFINFPRGGQNINNLFYKAQITKVKRLKNDIYLTIDDEKTVVLCQAKIIEEEADILNCTVNAAELYKKDGYYELHFLLINRGSDFEYFYVTYAFENLKTAK